MANRKKKLVREVISQIQDFKFCGPSDDPDETTAVTAEFRYLTIQLKRMVAPLLPEVTARRLESIDVQFNDIYSAYDARAEVDALLPDIEQAIDELNNEGKEEDMLIENKIVRVRCSSCGGKLRNHMVIFGHSEKWIKIDVYGYRTYEIVKCMGCDSIRFRISETNSEDVEPADDDPTVVEHVVYERGLFPDGDQGHRQPIESSEFPDDVAKMYLETIKCFNAGALTLAGGGLRAIVEAICKDRNVNNGNLKTKIDTLVDQGYLVKAQADLLHEERYIGNFALHEMRTPTEQDIEDGLQIVEGMMTTIYVLPLRAERLRSRRDHKN